MGMVRACGQTHSRQPFHDEVAVIIGAATEAGIRNELDTAWQQYETARSLLTRIEGEMLDKARGVLASMEYSYRAGEASLVEFLDAQRAFNDTMQGYNEARAAYARGLYLIDSVTGKDTW